MSNLYLQKRQDLNRPLFIPFTVLGDPDVETSAKIVETLIENGADALELGLPFSDPPADGPIIQAADVRALEGGITIDHCFDILKKIALSGPGPGPDPIPVGLLVYFNLVLQRGIDRFYQDCAGAGVSSVLIADLPLEHSDEVCVVAKKHSIVQVFMISELSTDERIAQVAAKAEGYIYVVSYTGVTGVQDAVMGDKVASLIERVRKHTDLPLVVGFGINTPEQVKAVAQAGADGIIVASRLVKEVPDVATIGTVCSELAQAVQSSS